MNFESLIRMMSYKRASDLFITTGIAPAIKVNGQLVAISSDPLSAEDVNEFVMQTVSERQRQELEEDKEINYAIDHGVLGRYRISAYHESNHLAMVLRRIETRIPTVEELELPVVLKRLAMLKRGLIIFVGPTGSGKSSSLASMIGFRNDNTTGHIISIEDPIEFVHRHNGCIITQREVGLDTESFEVALKNSLRQAPDVIQIGEIRTADTMDMAISFAETGHLCLATLHANNANQALERIINFFPRERHDQILLNLSLNLRGIVAQQLVPRTDRIGRVVACEVLINTPAISEHIRRGEVDTVKDLMSRTNEREVQTFDQALFKLYCEHKISKEDALKYADSENNIRLMIKLREEGKTIEKASNHASPDESPDDFLPPDKKKPKFSLRDED